MSKNTQRLGATLSNRMKKTADGAVPTTIELGVVNSNLSITTDSLQAEIPKGDYMVNLMLTGSRSTSIESHTHSGADHSHSGGVHSHELPDSLRGLHAGDRVLVSWCGNEPVVIAIVGTSTVLTFSEGGTSTGGGSSGSDGEGSGSGGTGSGSSGTPGQDGEDGFSPTILVTPITGGNRVTITDINGPKTFDVMDGKTPVKGKDYFTAEEVDTIVQEAVKRVLASIEDKFYTKEQIDTQFEEKMVTGEEIQSLISEVFGEK